MHGESPESNNICRGVCLSTKNGLPCLPEIAGHPIFLIAFTMVEGISRTDTSFVLRLKYLKPDTVPINKVSVIQLFYRPNIISSQSGYVFISHPSKRHKPAPVPNQIKPEESFFMAPIVLLGSPSGITNWTKWV